ncbi:NPL4 family protein [Cryptosporidium muris RN66]|uniref:NPL4 family protein n=1 Tax=Cryptosporidium muris (strain RN66) TaxID=441375 RepID=B6AFM4_CRYMR|nr:NPL4 family protein [Cryptosporidium muris RN66]EEA07015.1 NPL4 family protein [Cryptosporidium muris RN66]|eukprot:XP_002141364.1 NPL4 family protein [Cryptosporidium muris RN66]
MNEEWVIRVFSTSGRSRVTVPSGCSLSMLKTKIAASLKVPEHQQLLSLDSSGNSLLKGDSLSLKQHGLSDGSVVFLITDVTPQVTCKLITRPQQMSTSDIPPMEKSSEMKSSDINESSNLTPRRQGSNGIVPQFKSFDSFLQERNYMIDDLPMKTSYKPINIAIGKINKIPPSITLKHQVYRHVDHLEMMNLAEVTDFVKYWTCNLQLQKQRIGWMYGYYKEDNTYPMGIRAVMEAIYEPPQTNNHKFGNLELEFDDFKSTVDTIAHSLGLECIGLIFTHKERDELLTSREIISLGKLQLDYLKYNHYTGYPVSNFIACTIAPCKKSEDSAPVPNAFAVSDLGLAFIRDHLLDEDNLDDDLHMKLRAEQKGELLPQVLEGGQETSRFDAHWFVVRVNESAPIRPRSLFNCNQFPRENRISTQTPADVATFIKNRLVNISSTSYQLLNDFHLLLHLAKLFDESTALSICNSIANKTPVDQTLIEILTSLN